MTTPPHIRITPFEERFASAFAELNLAWITRYFAVEPEDEWVLNNPREAVLPSVRPMQAAELAYSMARTPVPVQPGQVSVNASVTVTLKIEPCES